LKSQESIRATGVGVIRVSGLTLSEGVDSVIGWLKDHVGEAQTTAALIKLIDWIEEQAGLPGFLKDRPRIGLIDFLSRRQTGLAADGLMFHVSLDPPNFRERTPLNKVHIKRHAADITRGFHLHIVIQNFDDVIRDSLLHIAPGQAEITIEAPTHVTDVELSAFGDNGEIVDFVSGSFTQGMSFGVSAIGSSDVLPPVYSGSPASPDLEKRPRLTSIATQNSPFKHYSGGFDAMRHNFDRLRLQIGDPASARANIWFGSGGDNQLAAIRWIKARLEQPGTVQGFLMDPFLGRDALERVVLRQGNQGIALKILVSPSKSGLAAASRDPDPLGKYLTDLVETAARWSSQLCGEVSMYHIKRGEGTSQAFHDRYLCTLDQAGTPTVYLLSNSLNKAAGDWPFCICELDRANSRLIYAYIQALMEGRDRGRDVEAKLIWETPPESPGTAGADIGPSADPR
jgi:hypothetical protein